MSCLIYISGSKVRAMTPKTLRAAIDDYDEVILSRLAPNSRRLRLSYLGKLYTWIAEETQPFVYISDVCDPEMRYMERWCNKHRPPKYKASTFNQIRSILTGFWGYVRARGWCHTNPMTFIKAMPVDRQQMLTLSPSELVHLLDDAKPRDRIALAVGMNMALRGGDIAALTVGQVDLTSSRIYAWISKTKKEEVLPVTQELRFEMMRWFHEYAREMNVTPATLPNDWRLIPPMHSRATAPGLADRRLTYNVRGLLHDPHRIARTYLERLGYSAPRMGFHVLRRSAAQASYELAKALGIPDPRAMPQALLRHKQRSTTEIYLNLNADHEVLDDMLRGKSLLGRAMEAERKVVDVA